MSDPIKTNTRADGSMFYWFRIEAGRNASRQRVQIYRSFDTKKAAKAEYARITNEINERRFVSRDGITLNGYLDRWEPAHGRDLEEAARASIRNALQPIRDRYGDRRIQSIERPDIDALVDFMLTSGRKRGGKPGTGLGPRTVQLMLVAGQRAWDDALDERLVSVNPFRRVKRPRQVKPVHELWSDEETAKFEAVAAQDRLHPVITMQCLGLRPEEVCGQRWRRDVDLKDRELTIQVVRTLVDGQVIEKPPKTDAGKRTLPLDDALTASLKAFHALQASEKLAAGEAYNDAEYVLCDELGLPYDPARLRRVYYRLMKQAAVRKIKPYTATRHAAGSYLARLGVSPAVIAAWLGHTDASFTMRTYVHARPEDLAAARDALAARKINEG
jgi:integrase